VTTIARPPGPHINLPLAVIAQMVPRLFPFDPLTWGLDIAHQYGDIAHYQLGPLHVYQIAHPDLARQILVEQADKFHKARLIKVAFAPFAGDGLLTSDGPLWKQQRKLMQPAFHYAHLTAYANEIVTRAAQLADALDDDRVVDVLDQMATLTLAVVVQCLFSADVTREAPEVGRLMTAVLDAANHRLNSVVRLPSWIPTSRNLREKRALARLDGILEAAIEAHRAAQTPSHDLLAMLLSALDEETGARYDQPPAARRDDDAVPGGSRDDRHGADVDVVTSFRSIRRSRRSSRVSWTGCSTAARRPRAISRTCRTRKWSFAKPCGSIRRRRVSRASRSRTSRSAGIPCPRAASSASTPTRCIATRDSSRTPERFDPERFARGWEERIPRYAYLPFGGGPRVCIGNGFAMMEARLIVATLAQRLRLSLERSRRSCRCSWSPCGPKHGLRMRVEKRRAAA
jgi:cytochrome P450